MRTILLVTATRIESRTVLEQFETHTGAPPSARSVNGRVYLTLGQLHDMNVVLVQTAAMGAITPGGALTTVQQSIADIQPDAVVMVGIAFGVNPAKQAIGDILVSESLRLYEPARMGTGGHVIPRGDRPRASESLVQRFKTAELVWNPSLAAKVRFGLILTGEKLIDNLDERNRASASEPEAIGGEMEGAGLYTACHEKVKWILVKAICDWADGAKGDHKDEYQRIAASNAVRFVLHALSFTQFDDTLAATPQVNPLPCTSASPAQPRSTVPVYVSYAWGGESEDLVDSIERRLPPEFQLMRDKRVLRPGDWISTFMRDIGRAGLVLVVISEKYLKSPYCMRELLYLYQTSTQDREAFSKRVIPLTVGPVRYARAAERAAHIRYWQEEDAKLTEAMKGLDPLSIGAADRAEQLLVKEVTSHVSDILYWISDTLMPRDASGVGVDAAIDLIRQRSGDGGLEG